LIVKACVTRKKLFRDQFLVTRWNCY